MALSEKEIAIRQVLTKRCDIIRTRVLPNVETDEERNYYAGKICGYEQAFDLISASIDSIKIEL